MSQLQRPSLISQYAEACLQALSSAGCGGSLSLGGAFGLAHYCEYRSTHDLDAWWIEPTTGEERQRVVRTLEEALQPFGQVRVRSWGDVVSVELKHEGKAVFSFQIARRSARLAEPVPTSWPGISVDTLADLVASKMVALVERGAPRDFRDIFMLCQGGHCDVAQCWELWQERQQLTGDAADLKRARLAIRTHLARIAQARPLQQIVDHEERSAAERLRTWFATELLNDVGN